jgi:hypothetical protein
MFKVLKLALYWIDWIIYHLILGVSNQKKISTLKRRYGTKSRGEVPTKAKTEIFIEAAQLRHYQFKPTDDLI